MQNHRVRQSLRSQVQSCNAGGSLHTRSSICLFRTPIRSLPCLWLSGILHGRISFGGKCSYKQHNQDFHLLLKASVACWARQQCAREGAASSDCPQMPQRQAACSGCLPECAPNQVTWPRPPHLHTSAIFSEHCCAISVLQVFSRQQHAGSSCRARARAGCLGH